MNFGGLQDNALLSGKIRDITDWSLKTFPQENPDEIKESVPKLVSSRPEASPDEIKAEITQVAMKHAPKSGASGSWDSPPPAPPAVSAPVQRPSLPSIPAAPEPVIEEAPAPSPVAMSPGVSPDARTMLYQKLREKYMSPELSSESRTAALKSAESKDMPSWRVNIAAGLKALAGKNPDEYRANVAKTNKERYEKAGKEFDDRKGSILEDVKSVATLDAAERNAQAMDPDSVLSNGLRKATLMMMPKAASIPGFDKMSAVDIEKISPQVTDWYKQQVAKELKLADIESEQDIENKRTASAEKLAGIKATSDKKDKDASDKKGQKEAFGDLFRNLEDLQALVTGHPVGKYFPDAVGGESGSVGQALKGVTDALRRVNNSNKGGRMMTPQQEQMLIGQIGNPKDVEAVKHITRFKNDMVARYKNAGHDPSDISSFISQGDAIGSSEGNGFPKKVYKSGKMATVGNQSELDDALKKGWQ